MRTIKGYRIIDLALSGSGAVAGSSHPIYLKEHASTRTVAAPSSSSSKSKGGSTLFVGNVDYTDGMSHTDIDAFLRLLLSRFGAVKSVSVSSFGDSGAAGAASSGAAASAPNTRFAHVDFEKKSSMKLALSASDRDYLVATKEVFDQFAAISHKKLAKDLKTPSKFRIRGLYPFVDEDAAELKEIVDSFMVDFEEGEQQVKAEKERRLNEVDDDGFQPVKNRNKRKRVVEERRGNSSEAGKLGRDRETQKKKKKEGELKNFYAHQIRQEKMLKLETLRKKFSEDKERVAKMKEAKKFKPF